MFNLDDKLALLQLAYNTNNIKDCARVVWEILNRDKDVVEVPDIDNMDDTPHHEDEDIRYLQQEISTTNLFLQSGVFKELFLHAYAKRSNDMLALFALVLPPTQFVTGQLLSLIHASPHYDSNYIPVPSDYFINNIATIGFLRHILNDKVPEITSDTVYKFVSRQLEQRIIDSINYFEPFYTGIFFKVFYKHHMSFTYDKELFNEVRSEFFDLIDSEEMWPLINDLIAYIIEDTDDPEPIIFDIFLSNAIEAKHLNALEFMLSLGFNTLDSIEQDRSYINKSIRFELPKGISLFLDYFSEESLRRMFSAEDILTDDAGDPDFSCPLHTAFFASSKISLAMLVDKLIEISLLEKLINKVFSKQISDDSVNSHKARAVILFKLCCNNKLDAGTLFHLFNDEELSAEKIQRALSLIPIRTAPEILPIRQNPEWPRVSVGSLMPVFHQHPLIEASYIDKFNVLVRASSPAALNPQFITNQFSLFHHRRVPENAAKMNSGQEHKFAKME